MTECIGSYFIHNEDIKNSSEFNDQSVLTGKSFYEVIRLIDGVYLFLEEHLERLNNSLSNSTYTNEIDLNTVTKRLQLLQHENNFKEGNIKIVVHFSDAMNTMDFFAYFVPHTYPSEEQYIKGIKLMLYRAERKNPNIKRINPELNLIRNRELTINPAYELLLVDSRGYITEASKANVFMVKENRVFTPPSDDVLQGITRNYVLKLCDELGIEVVEKRIPVESLTAFDAVFISGTSPKILPVNSIDNHKFTTNNQVVKSLMRTYENLINQYVEGHK